MFLHRKLTNPLVFFDFETTHKDVALARIVEFAFLKVMPDGSELRLQGLVNPEMDIPAESTAIHGISNDAVKDMPTFKQYAPAIIEFIGGCDLAGFNSNRYDIPILVRELSDANISLDISKIEVVDVRNIHTRKERRDLSAVYKFYTGKDLDDAHSAMIDVMATKMILEEQFWKYKEDFPETIEELAKYSNFDQKMFDPTGTLYRTEEGIICFAFGKHKDKPLVSEQKYLQWMLGADFAPSVCEIVRAHLI